MKHRTIVRIVVAIVLLLVLSTFSSASPRQALPALGEMGVAPLEVQSATFTSMKDSFASEAAPGTTHGGFSDMLVGGAVGTRLESYVQFDLSTLPPGAVVSSATLRLSQVVNMTSSAASPDADLPVHTYMATSNWTEGSLTWNNRPSLADAGDPFTLVGGSPGYHYWTVSNAVDDWVSGSRTNYGFRLYGSEAGGSTRSFSTREASAAARPQLEVFYTVAPPAELTVSKTLVAPAGGEAQVGETISYDITIRNTGTVRVQTIPLVDRFEPACFTWLDATPSEDSPQADGGIWYDLGPLDPGQSQQLQVRLTAASACDNAWNRAGVTTAVDVHGRAVPGDLGEATVDLVAAPTATPTSTPTPYPMVVGSCPGEVTIWASKDAWVNESDPERNYGASEVLQTSRKNSAFQLPLFYFPLDQAAIPADMSIYSADLMLDRAGNEEPLSVATLTVRRLADPWDESTVNWANYGYRGEGSLDVVHQVVSDPVHVFSVTDQVRRWHSGEDENNGLMIENLISKAIWYHSREAAREEQPKIVITCGEATPTPTPTRTPTPTASPTPTVTPTRVPIDYKIDNMEITQGIAQLGGTTNGYAAIEYKPTFVRVWASAIENGAPITMPAIVMLSAMKNGQPLDPQLLAPITNPGGVKAAGWDRASKNDAFLFKLPRDWTEGEVEITAKVNGIFSEGTSLLNDRMKRTIRFYSLPPTCGVFIRVRSTAGSPAKWYMSDTQDGRDMIERAISLLPINKFRTFTQSEKVEKLDWCGIIPCGYTGYDVDDDDWMIVHSLWWRDQFSDDPDSCDDAGSDTHYIGMVKPEETSANGMGGVGLDQLFFVLRTSNPTDSGAELFYNGEEINKPWGGRSLAHELGHNQWRYHPGCGTDDEDDDYPYNNCWFSELIPGNPAAEFWGFDPITLTPIQPNADVGDLMSYNGLRWTSDYTREEIRLEMADPWLSGQALATDSSPDAGDLLVVSGVLGGSVAENQFYRLARLQPDVLPAKKRTEIAGNPAQTKGAFRLELLDDGGGILAAQLFDTSLVTNQVRKFQFFGLSVPWVPGTRAVQVTSGGQVVIRERVSEHAPRVNLVSPEAGTAYGQSLPIAWTAVDADGDVLLFDVQYSHDNGQSWTLLASQIFETQIDADVETVAGSDGQSLIRVIASDGLLTGSDTTPYGFSLDKHSPQPVIASPAEGDLFLTGTSIPLSGFAFDAEDGYLEGDALRWQVTDHGDAGTGEESLVQGLSVGQHTIILRATDSDFDVAYASIQITVIDPKLIYLPVLTIGS